MKKAYKFDENSPVISFKDGSFGFNYKNVEASTNALKNILACQNIRVYRPVRKDLKKQAITIKL